MANIDYPTRLGHQKAIQGDQYGLTLYTIGKLFKRNSNVKMYIFFHPKNDVGGNIQGNVPKMKLSTILLRK